MKKLNFKTRKNQKGITLVALVITIVILLILSGIAIASLTGDNGLFARARQAREETLTAQEDELRKLTMLEASANLENCPYTDENGDTATIPAGFAVSQVEGENTIANGLVIIDKNGNEFVWVPVDDENFTRYEGYENSKLQSHLNNCEEPYAGGLANEELYYSQMKNSVLKYDGFYVGRYEAGTESTEERSNSSGTTDNVVIKQGTYVYNYIGWSDSDDMTDETGGAVEKSKNFSKDNGYTSVTSTLIYGVQWDAIMQWIDPAYKDESCDIENSFVANSTGRGNYTGILATTGSNKAYAVNNIYDLAGNVSEWTMESCYTYRRVFRGGDYGNTGINIPASERRLTYLPSYIAEFIGFRIALYIN